MNRDALFMATIEDLHHKLHYDASAYESLRSSGLMRQLILDQSPLVHQVNRRRQELITFRWVEVRSSEFARRGVPMPATFAIGFGIDAAEGYPEGAMCCFHASGGDRSFLRATIALLDGEPITVRDVIKHAANVDGGVHAGVTP